MPETFATPGENWAGDPRLALNHLVKLVESMDASLTTIKHALVGEDDETPGVRDDLTLLTEQVDAVDTALRNMNGKVRVTAAELVRAYTQAREEQESDAEPA